MQSFEDFSRKHRIGTLPPSFRTEKPSADDVIDVLKPSLVGIPVLAGLYYAGGAPAFAVGLAGAVAVALWDVKRVYSGWAFEPYPEITVLNEEEIKDLIEEHGRWWGQDLQDALDANGIQAKVVAKDSSSSTVDVYELDVTKGFDINRVANLGDNFTRDLGLSKGIKFSVEANIGNGRAGLFIPKAKRELITLVELINQESLKKMRLPILVGKDLGGNLAAFDLVNAKHLLIGGETGSGKSVEFSNAILGLAYHCSPDQLELTLIDPKMVELSMFDGLPHIEGDAKTAIIDMEEATHRLIYLYEEMQSRYEAMHKAGVRNIESYNALGKEYLKYKVIVIDEITEIIDLDDTITIEDKEQKIGKVAEKYVTKLARLGRAAGMLLIIGAQRFDAETFKGQLRANIPSAIGMRVKKRVYSEMLIEQSGCENLLGNGDCYVLLTGSQAPVRCQAAFIDETGIEAMVKAIGEKWSAPSI